MKRTFIAAVFASVLGGLCLYFQARWNGDSVSSSVHWALIMGGLFFVTSFFLQLYLARMKRIEVPKLNSEETFFHADWVTYPMGWELVGGALYLTSKRLIFCPSRGNFHKVDFSMPLSAITSTRIFRLRFARWSRLGVTDQTGKETVFIVGGPKIWAEKIRLARESTKA